MVLATPSSREPTSAPKADFRRDYVRGGLVGDIQPHLLYLASMYTSCSLPIVDVLSSFRRLSRTMLRRAIFSDLVMKLFFSL